MMYSCIKNHFLVAEDTLVLYDGNDPDVVVPEEIEPGHPIRRIGAGVFSKVASLKTVYLPDSIQQIGRSSFEWCPQLNQVSLPLHLQLEGEVFDGCMALKEGKLLFRMTAEEYADLRRNCREAGDQRLCIRDMSHIAGAMAGIIRALGFSLPQKLPEDVPLLFLHTDNPGVRQVGKTNQPLRSLSCLHFDGGSGNAIENGGVRALIDAGIFRSGTPKQEQRSDYYLRTETKPGYTELTIPFFREENIRRESNNVFTLQMELFTGFLFWQSIQRVRYQGNFYYIYRRNYLTNSPERDFDRLDVAVYDDTGLVRDVDLAEAIYAKYRLLAIL